MRGYLTPRWTVCLNGGILSSSIANVIRLAQALNISVDGLAAGEIKPAAPPSQLPVKPLTTEEAALLDAYRKLNADGRQYIQQQMRIALTIYAGECDDVPHAEAVNE